MTDRKKAYLLIGVSIAAIIVWKLMFAFDPELAALDQNRQDYRNAEAFCQQRWTEQIERYPNLPADLATPAMRQDYYNCMANQRARGAYK